MGPIDQRDLGANSVSTPDLTDADDATDTLDGAGGVEPDEESPGRCALDGCDLPVPGRVLDEHGRAKGGRRARYCSKAHADAASRQRRAQAVASVDDPLTAAREAGAAVVPIARELATALSELLARFDEAEAGALARVGAAEREAAQAQEEAQAALAAADAAERGRREALAQARADRQARDTAERAADRARTDSEQVRVAAWEQVAVHERARGQAEAAHAAAASTAEHVGAQNRDLRELLDHERRRAAEREQAHTRTATDLDRAVTDLTRTAAEVDRTAAELDRTRAELDRIRGEVEAANARAIEAERRARAEHDQAQAQAERLRRADAELVRLRARLDPPEPAGGTARGGRGTPRARPTPRVPGRPRRRPRPV
jgi:chromosome segregation ATPase